MKSLKLGPDIFRRSKTKKQPKISREIRANETPTKSRAWAREDEFARARRPSEKERMGGKRKTLNFQNNFIEKTERTKRKNIFYSSTK
jgi:hypothetical protein